MSRPRMYHTEAIVLRTSPLGEADRLFTLLTPRLGKLRATARGVRRPTSKLGGHLDPLTRSSLTINRGRNLDTIASADTLETFPLVKENLERLSLAIYGVELVDAFSPEEASSPQVYALFLETLQTLGTAPGPDLALRYFELHLLIFAGFSPILDRCVECHEQVLPGHHLFSPSASGILCPACRGSQPQAAPISVDALKSMRFLASQTMQSAMRLRLNPSIQREVAALLSAFLRYVLDREVRSTSFLRSVTRLPQRGDDIPAPASTM